MLSQVCFNFRQGLTILFQSVPTDEQINTERLKQRDKILFYSEIMLFEDELHDSGCSFLSVKIVSTNYN